MTVLMSVYNGRNYLRDAIKSILRQTWSDFELLIINDGSSDNSGEIISSFDDPRIRLVENPVNVGLTKCLNRGLKLAKSNLIARQDADDISLPNRLAHQLSYLESHPDIVLLGTWVKVVDENSKVLRDTCSPIKPFVLKWRMLFSNQIVHSSVMFRLDKIWQLGGYDDSLAYSQDYDLWLRVMTKHRISLLPEILVHRREHANDISTKYIDSQNSTADRIACRYLSNLLKKKISIEDVHNFREIIHYRMISSPDDFKRSLKLLQEVYKAVLRKWEPDAENTALITNDYLRMIKVIASMCANLERKASFDILKNTINKDTISLFDISTASCLLKILIGPKLLPKFRRFLGRPDLEHRPIG
ncbi:MAG: glycosyltransferase [Candidatus Omnitrophica bacterium]|nr:glycosyltransferase [Candidatus Omnitrophota bacterium]